MYFVPRTGWDIFGSGRPPRFWIFDARMERTTQGGHEGFGDLVKIAQGELSVVELAGSLGILDGAADDGP